MSETETCTHPPCQRLVENYHRCLSWRLEAWFGPDAKAERHGPGSCFTARHGDWSAQLEFHPQACRWSLVSGTVRAEGSFDRVSKRLRQIFSGLD